MIDENSRSPFTVMLEQVMGDYLKDNVYTQVPGHIVEFDPATQLATVQIGLKGQRTSGEYETPNPIVMCPVQFAGSQFGTIEFQVGDGTEGLISFSHWAIDTWVQSGGVQVRQDIRQFDGADAFFTPGFRSMPNAIQGFANNGIRLRSADGSAYYWVKNDGTVEVDGTEQIVRCPTRFMAPVIFDDAMTSRGKDVSSTHTHTGVQTGNGITGPVK